MMFNLTLETSYPRWHGEQSQESSTNGKDWEHSCRWCARCPPSQACWVKCYSTGGQPWNQIVKLKKKKRTLNPYKGNFKISFNSLLGSKKHMSKQNNKSKTRCYIEKLKEQNAAYSGSFS